MKSIAAQVIVHLRKGPTRSNGLVLLRFLAVLVAMVAAYSVVFHYLMLYEERLGYGDREHSWVTAVYWTLTVMSTLGFGDITFESDIGRAFSMLVLVSGTLFLLVLLPFTFIQFFYAPWMEAQRAARVPRRLPEDLADHVVISGTGPVVDDLIERFDQFGQRYVLLAGDDIEEALRLREMGLRVMLGEPDEVETFQLCRASAAAVFVACGEDVANANAVFVAREAAPHTPIVSAARTASAAKIQKLAGATRVVEFSELMGESLARRTIGGDADDVADGNVTEEGRPTLGGLLIAEANASRTPLVGKTLRENRLRDLGPSVLGVWDRGRFELATPDVVVSEHAVLLMAGTREQLEAYDESFVIYNVSGEPAVVIGGGRVGRATARSLKRRGISCNIVEQRPDRIDPSDVPEGTRIITGDAADPKVLQEAGLDDASSVLITTSDDATNIYLTLQMRHLKPDAQIVARAERDRSVDVLHRAGADVTMSMASVGVSRILKFVARADILPIAEGLNVIRLPSPDSMIGHKIEELDVRRDSGATIVAVDQGNGDIRVNPPADLVLEAGSELLFIGTAETEQKFLEKYSR
ncbi:MAG: NAD-binding protein [Planctomycetota bacterium]